MSSVSERQPVRGGVDACPPAGSTSALIAAVAPSTCGRHFFIDNLLVRVDACGDQVEKGIHHDGRPIHQILLMIKWIRTSRLSKPNSLFGGTWAIPPDGERRGASGIVTNADADILGAANLAWR